MAIEEKIGFFTYKVQIIPLNSLSPIFDYIPPFMLPSRLGNPLRVMYYQRLFREG